MSSASTILTSSDVALLRVLAARGEDPDPRFWTMFRPGLGARLRAAWEHGQPEAGTSAVDALRAEHAAQAKPDLARIHPSWFVRALKDESPAVQRVVVANAGPALAAILKQGLGLSARDLERDASPHADALNWALTLWTERLIGDRLERDDDPPAIVALTRLGPREGVRLIRCVGLAKCAVAGSDVPVLRQLDFERLRHFEDRLAHIDREARELAKRDVAGISRSRRHLLLRLGMVTVARLLEEAEPYRVRWALQHLPYAAAKFTRSIMSTVGRRDPVLLGWESELLRAAWDRLRAEGRIARDWGTVP